MFTFVTTAKVSSTCICVSTKLHKPFLLKTFQYVMYQTQRAKMFRICTSLCLYCLNKPSQRNKCITKGHYGGFLVFLYKAKQTVCGRFEGQGHSPQGQIVVYKTNGDTGYFFFDLLTMRTINAALITTLSSSFCVKRLVIYRLTCKHM